LPDSKFYDALQNQYVQFVLATVQSARGQTVVAAATAAVVVAAAVVALEKGGLAERNKTLPKRNGRIKSFLLITDISFGVLDPLIML
jgi:hypothetical protein